MSAASPDTGRLDRQLLSAAAAIFVVFAVIAIALAISTHAMLDVTSGVWLSMGIDAARGIFYRPILGDAGIGGTRYFPLTFLLLAAFIRAGMSPLAAGHTIQLLSGAALVWGAFRLLDEASVPRPFARALAVLALCSTPAMFALTTIRGDLLPVALNIWGLLFGARALARDRPSSLVASIVCFSLAIFAKPTAAYAMVGVAVAFLLSGRVRQTVLVAGGTALASGALLAIANVWSGGRMIESFRACAGAGLDWSTLRRAPLGAASALVRQDPISTLLIVLTAVSMLNLRRDEWKEPLTSVTVACLATTVLLYALPGVDFNHLVDFFALATLFVGVQIARREVFRATAARAIAVAAMLSLVAFYLDIRHSMLDANVPARAAAAAFVQDMPGHASIFADTGLVPSSIGERNFVLDGFLLPALRSHGFDPDPAIARSLEERRFDAVVLMTRDSARLGYLYGAGFPKALARNYDEVKTIASYVIYRPKPAVR